MNHFEEIATTITDFLENDALVDWTIIIGDEDRCDEAFEAIDTLTDAIALLPELPYSKRVQWVGIITIARTHLVDGLQKENEQQVTIAGDTIINTIKEILNSTDILERGAEMSAQVGSMTAQEELTNGPDIESLSPFLATMACYGLITLDQEAEEE